MFTPRTALFLVLLASPALAEDWQRLKGDQITAALSARVLAYEGGKTQNFFADGRTLHDGGSAQSGRPGGARRRHPVHG